MDAMSHLDLYSMFMLGLLGTGHCVGMCGPLVLAFPARTGKFSSHLFYHLGRISTYAFIGCGIGAIGVGIKTVATGLEQIDWIARIQVGFSLLAAGFLFFFGMARLNIVAEPTWMSSATPLRIPGWSKVLGSAGHKRGQSGMMLTGMMLGLLPCGLSYAAFARALPSGGAVDGGLMLLAFGLGTVPGLLLIGTGASRLARRYQRHFDILSALLMIGMSLSLFADAIQSING
jgi:sulfite exporter TauE/SafE